MRCSRFARRSARSSRARRTSRTTCPRTRRIRSPTSSWRSGTARIRASAPDSRRPPRASTRCGRPWAASTTPTATATSCAPVPRWRATRLPRTETALSWTLLIEPEGRPGPDNMALDRALLEEADGGGAAFLRLYRWNPPCLSFGRNEPALARYDRARIAARGLSVVRRPTGGRAVWHEHEVTYAVAAPIAAFGSLAESYCDIHARLARALGTLRLDAQLAPAGRSAPLGARACFAASAGGEVLVGRRKLRRS